MDRQILHSDMNSFYAGVETMLHPALRGKAVAVCGSTESRHGIVLAKSEPAKRAGVKTGMVNWEARLVCPDLILVPPHYEEYLKYSALARNIYGRYTDLVEPFGMDECWLDVTQSGALGTGAEIAEKIRASVREELGLTVSIGVSFNKIFAKLGSDMKKPDAVTEITRENFRQIVWPLPASDLIYVGRATAAKLKKYGVSTVGELAAVAPETLQRWFGINGIKLWRYANGTDQSRVMPQDFSAPVKSVGHGITCTADLDNERAVFRVMLELSQDVGRRLRAYGLAAKGVQIAVRCRNLSGMQFQCALPCPTQLPSELTAAGFALFQAHYPWSEPVRAVTIRASDLIPQNTPEQLSLFVNNARREKRKQLEGTVEEIRSRFGRQALTYACLLGDLKIPDDGRDLVRMPSPMYT